MLNAAEGLIYVQLLSRDVERLADLIRLIAVSGRKVVMNASLAILWNTVISLGYQLSTPFASSTAAEIRVIDFTMPEGADIPFEMISLEEIASGKKDFVYFLTLPHYTHLIELETLGEYCGASHFIHLEHPFRAKNPIVATYIEEFGMVLHNLAVDGHAYPNEISDLVEHIAPDVLIPVHGFNPRLLNTPGIRRYFPRKGETVTIPDILSSAAFINDSTHVPDSKY